MIRIQPWLAGCACAAALALGLTGTGRPADAARATAGSTAGGNAVLVRASRVYAGMPSFRDVARYRIQVPGAPVHEEVGEYGWGSGLDVYVRMPSLYEVRIARGRVYVTADGNTDAHLDSPASSDLQASVDAAFGGKGPPLVPVPVLLRSAHSDAERLEAFRLRLLHPLRVTGRRMLPGPRQEILLLADNGLVRAEFDARRGCLVAVHAEVVPAPGQDPIVADITFAPRPGQAPRPGALSAILRGRVAANLDALSDTTATGRRTGAPPPEFTSLAGARVRLQDFQDSIVVVEFWATWCAPCRATLPAMQRFATWARERGLPVRVLLVNTREQDASVAAARPRLLRYLRSAGVSLPTVLDLDGSAHDAVGGGLPLTVVMTPDGRTLASYHGFTPDLEGALQAHAPGWSRAVRR
jgi:thiol-disulfide isomerase/thioredoxin